MFWSGVYILLYRGSVFFCIVLVLQHIFSNWETIKSINSILFCSKNIHTSLNFLINRIEYIPLSQTQEIHITVKKKKKNGCVGWRGVQREKNIYKYKKYIYNTKN